MTNGEERSPEILKLVPRYVGIFAGVATLLAKGISHAGVGGLKALGGLFASPREKSEVSRAPAPESAGEIVPVEPSELAEDEAGGAPASGRVEGQGEAKSEVGPEPGLASNPEQESAGDIRAPEEPGTATEDKET